MAVGSERQVGGACSWLSCRTLGSTATLSAHGLTSQCSCPQKWTRTAAGKGHMQGSGLGSPTRELCSLPLFSLFSLLRILLPLDHLPALFTWPTLTHLSKPSLASAPSEQPFWTSLLELIPSPVLTLPLGSDGIHRPQQRRRRLSHNQPCAPQP